VRELDELQQIAQGSGLQWVNSDADKISAAHAAMAGRTGLVVAHWSGRFVLVPTEQAVADLHRLLGDAALPAAVFKPACEECSLYDICLPRVTASPEKAAHAARRIFEI
jgi:hypothetical protein